jgi:hypothetical protein
LVLAGSGPDSIGRRKAAPHKCRERPFAGLSTWKQGDFVEKANWANIPEIESGKSKIAELCATKLIAT